MATRVHELAKELGLKSPELLDRIQKWNLDVKPSALASLDPSMVERIKQLMKGSPSSSAPSAPPSPSPSEAPAIRPSTTLAPPRSQAHTPPTPAPTAAAKAPSPAPPRAPSPEAPARSAPPASTVKAPTPATTTAPAPASSSTEAVAPIQAQAPAQTPPPPSGLTAPPRAAGSSPGASTPSHAPGPLSSHTTHRVATGSQTGGPKPGGGRGPRPGDGGSSGQAAPRPAPTPAPPLKRPMDRGDYISPAGTRGPLTGRSSAGHAQGRRPSEQPQGQNEGPRRDSPPPSGSRRPLPTVASPTILGPPPRRPDAPRSGGPEAKVQRPEKRYTAEEMRAMMQAGKLGGAPSAPPRPGQAPARPGGPPGSVPSSPGLRRPPVGVGAGSPPPLMTDEDEKPKGVHGSRLGTPADRANRRAKRTDRAKERIVTSPVSASTLIEGGVEEETGRTRGRGSRRGHKGRGGVSTAPVRKTHAVIEPPITLRTLSEAMGIPAKDLIRKLMNNMGQLVTINANLDEELAMELAMEFGVELNIVYERTAEDELDEAFAAAEASDEGMVLRPPIITILGHVDHGKTSLLDKIRKANVVASETGGITQHIGAYQVEHDGKKLAFVDTPGHEAFTAMRARGANVTDIVVLVVAADDGVMPQTKEAIAHAKAAEVPVVVALNKIDLPNVDTQANLNKIYGELSQEGLIPEEYGGDTPVVKTSTLTGAGIGDLLATLDALAELHELKANPDRSATGTCLEASVSEGRGVLATVMVQDGTLKVGDVVVCGDAFGRVRALFNDLGQSIQQAGPSTPVEISGLDLVPTAGERFAALDDITRAREIAETRRGRSRGVALGDHQAITLENLFSKMAEQKLKSLNLIIKADVQGSLEALAKELEKLENAEVPIRILMKGVGGIGESDVILADASEAIVIGFRVAPEDRALALANEKKIDIRRYDIIYQVTDEVKKAVEGMLVPEYKEVHLGRATVRQVFKISKSGTVAGCFVTQGTIERAAKARVIREGREIYKGSIDALKRFKDDVKEVREGFECGIKISNYDDLKIDDTIEAFRVDVIRRTL